MSTRWQGVGSTTPREIAEEINSALIWAGTPQGADFWQAVYSELYALQAELDGNGPYQPSAEWERFLGRRRAATTLGGVSNKVAVSRGVSHRCIDCTLLRCSAPDTRCPECDANIKGGP